MASKVTQRTVYLVTGIIVASLIGGFAVATMSLQGAPNTTYQGSHTTNVQSIPGLTWTYTNVSVVATNGFGSVFSTCNSLQTACDITSASATFCAGGFVGSTTCAVSDYVEQVNLTVSDTVALPGTVALTLYVTGTPVGGSSAVTVTGATFYFLETVVPSSPQTILLDFDIGTILTGPGAVTTVSVLGST
jgi:hypothetical protein